MLQRSLVLCHLRSLRTVTLFSADLQIGSTSAAGYRKGQPSPGHLDLLQLSTQLPDNSVLSPGPLLKVSESASLMPSGFFYCAPF